MSEYIQLLETTANTDKCVCFPVTYKGTKVYSTISKEDESWVSRYTWTASNNGRHSGNIYVYRIVPGKDGKQKKIYLHHEVMRSKPGDGECRDHINRDTLCNTRENLRIVTRGENNMNRGPVRTRNGRPTSSSYKGVSWDKDRKKWKAQISHNYKTYCLGLFEEERDAAAVYDLKAKELHGEYAWLNFSEKEVIVEAA